MSTEASRLRTEPKKKVHRKMLELTTTPAQTDMLMKQIMREYLRLINAQKDFDCFVKETIIEGIIEAGNEKLQPEDQQESMTLYTSDGKFRFNIGRSSRRFFDDRVHQAKVFLQDFINEYETSSVDASPDIVVLITMLKSLFFGNKAGGKHFKYTPELQAFLSMSPDDLHDERVRKAHEILNSCIHVTKGKWYTTISEYNEETLEYEVLK